MLCVKFNGSVSNSKEEIKRVRERKTGDEESVREREKTDRRRDAKKMGEPEKKGSERGKKARDD